MKNYQQLKKRNPKCRECRMCEGSFLTWQGTPQADILFISDYPRWEDAQRGTFGGDAGQTFKKLICMVRDKYPSNHPIHNLSFRIGYAMQCGFSDREDKTKPTTKDAQLCSWVRDQKLSETSPRLIISMGKLATQAVGVSDKNFDNVRGKVQQVAVDGVEYDVFPTFHPLAVYLNTGLTKTFLNEIEAGLGYALSGDMAMAGSVAEEIEGYEYPETPEDLKLLTQKILDYKGPKWPIAVDTETNSLDMHLPTAKCIAFSVAWDKGKSAAWLMNHKAISKEGDPEVWWRFMPYVFNLLLGPNPKIAHNFQFDLRVFRHLVRCLVSLHELVPWYAQWFTKECHHTLEDIVAADGINNMSWDSMLAEHSLEEDKKGLYGLKSIIRKYAPIFVGYEKSLKTNEFGKELRNLADFIEYVESTDDIKGLRERTRHLHDWFEAFRPDSSFEIPERVIRFIGVDNTNPRVSDFRNRIMKSTMKRAWQKTVREWVTARWEKDGWKQFNKGPKQAREMIDSLGGQVPHIVEDYLWFMWFRKNASKDFVKATVKAIAREMKATMEKERADVNFENFDVTDLLVYAAIDTDMTIRAAGEQIKQFVAEEKRDPSTAYDTETGQETPLTAMRKLSNPLCVALSKMVDTGVAVDYEYLDWLEVKYTEQAEEMHEKIFELSGIKGRKLGGVDLNLNSTAHVATILEHAGYTLTERTATGQLRVTKAILKELSKQEKAGMSKEEQKTTVTLMDAILTYRESLKARDTFLQNFRMYAAKDGRVHPSFHQIGTATYRLSSSRPNFQNIPKELAGYNIKKCLVPSHPDWCIVNIDASGAEVKSLTAYLAMLEGEHRGEQLIYEMNYDPNFDMHSKFCSYIFGPSLFGLDVSSPEAWDKAYHWVRANKDDNPAVGKARGKTKAVVFGTLYGQTAHGLANLLGIPLDEAEFIIEQFFAADPSIGAYVSWSQRLVVAQGYVSTILGRKRRFPLARLDRKSQRRSMRQATNFLIQSLTVDIFNYLLAHFIEVLVSDLGGRPLMQVHDALVMEMPKKNLVKAVDIMGYHFTDKVKRDFPWFPVGFKCDIDAGDSYGEMAPASKYIESERLEASDFIDQSDRDGADFRLRTEEDPDEAYLAKDIITFED